MKHFAQTTGTCLLLLCLAFPAAAADAPPQRPDGAPVLAHIHIYCNRLEPMIEFWIKAFDAHLILRRKFGNDDGAVLDIGTVPLYIQQSQVNAGKAGIAAYDHIGLRVGDIEAALKKSLAAPEAKLDKDIHAVGVEGKSKAAFVRGPEGILVELVQPPR